jgi:hypothetical protein
MRALIIYDQSKMRRKLLIQAVVKPPRCKRQTELDRSQAAQCKKAITNISADQNIWADIQTLRREDGKIELVKLWSSCLGSWTGFSIDSSRNVWHQILEIEISHSLNSLML